MSFENNVHWGPGGIGFFWYTKRIDLSGFSNLKVEGKLRFSLSPYQSANVVYDVYDRQSDPDNPTLRNRIKIQPGVFNYNYEVPFSSEDFIDPKFNALLGLAADRNGDTEELFNHAFLHEWGRIYSSDHGQTARVGKLTPQQFHNQDDYEAFLNDLREYDSLVDWPGDPEHAIVGWKCSQENYSDQLEDSLDCYLGSYEEGCQLLNEYSPFRNGTFNYIRTFTLHANPAVTYILGMITRPIAFSKSYDEKGNITSIEKPIFPSSNAYFFTRKHWDADIHERDKDNDGIANLNIYRYRLTENEPSGIMLTGYEQPLIVDVDLKDGAYFMFQSEDEADAFYKKRLAKLETSYYGNLDIREENPNNPWETVQIPTFIISDSSKIRLENWLPKTSISVSKAWKDYDNKWGKRPESVDVFLLANGKETGQYITLNAANAWKGSFDNQDLYSYKRDEATGKISWEFINYSIRESNVPYYESHFDIQQKSLNNVDILLTNTYTDQLVNLDIDKTWVDENNKDMARPPFIKVNLLKNGNYFDSIKISESDGWKARFENLARYDEKGEEIKYSIFEEPVEGYEPSISGFHITNIRKPKETCPPCNPSETSPSQPCQPSTPCNPSTPCSPCEPHDSTNWPLTPQQKTPSYVVTKPTESKTTTSVTGTKAPQSTGMLPVTADESWMNVLYAAVLLALAGLVMGLRYEMKRRKEN